MSLALLVPSATTTALASSSPMSGERKTPYLRHRGGIVTLRASSSSSSSPSSPDREPFSPSSPLDFRPVFALSPPRGQPTLQDARLELVFLCLRAREGERESEERESGEEGKKKKSMPRK